MTRGRKRRSRDACRATRGFSLIEALVAVALMGLVVGLLGVVTSRWLPVWNFGLGRLQRADLVGLAVDRIAADLASAEFVALDRKSQKASFDGTATSVLFVRSTLGPNVAEGLEIVKIEEVPDKDGFALVRARAPFALLGREEGESPDIVFTDKVTLLRSPYRTYLSFADATLAWRDLWRNVPSLPSVVKISVVDERKGPAPFVSAIASLHMSAPAICSGAKSAWACIEEYSREGSVRVDAAPTEQKDREERNR